MCSATTPSWSTKEKFQKPTNNCSTPSGKEEKFPSTTRLTVFSRDSFEHGEKKRRSSTLRSLPRRSRCPREATPTACNLRWPESIHSSSLMPTIQRETSLGHPIDWVALEPAPVQVNPMMLAAKAPHPNAGKLFIDFLLSKEGQKMLVGFRRIPVREDVDADPPRLFKGYKRVVEHPEDYRNFNETVRLYQEILGIR